MEKSKIALAYLTTGPLLRGLYYFLTLPQTYLLTLEEADTWVGEVEKRNNTFVREPNFYKKYQDKVYDKNYLNIVHNSQNWGVSDMNIMKLVFV